MILEIDMLVGGIQLPVRASSVDTIGSPSQSGCSGSCQGGCSDGCGIDLSY